ncbi:MAG: hypothetical protein HY558_05140 [Euryarchaeota archaeon]|nr:hypothetical protein [Euryarchaeota archaeon]
MEPSVDLVAILLVVVGLVLFGGVLVQAWEGYQDRSFAVQRARDAYGLARALRGDPGLGVEGRPGVLDGGKLAALSGNCPGKGGGPCRELFDRYGRSFGIEVSVRAGGFSAVFRSTERPLRPGPGAAVPVAVRLGDARDGVNGTLTVRIGRPG